MFSEYRKIKKWTTGSNFGLSKYFEFHNMLSEKQRVKGKITRQIRKYAGLKENENITYQN